MNTKSILKRFWSIFRPSKTKGPPRQKAIPGIFRLSSKEIFIMIGIIIRDCSLRAVRSIFLFAYRPIMKPCPSQPYPGEGYLCQVCIHGRIPEYLLPLKCTIMKEYYEDGYMVHIHPDLIALTPRGKHFSLIRFNCDNSPEPDPIFGKDYTERCNYFEQDWDNDDYNGIDLARQAYAFCKFEPPDPDF